MFVDMNKLDIDKIVKNNKTDIVFCNRHPFYEQDVENAIKQAIKQVIPQILEYAADNCVTDWNVVSDSTNQRIETYVIKGSITGLKDDIIKQLEI
jgi:predicted Zn-dependent protease